MKFTLSVGLLAAAASVAATTCSSDCVDACYFANVPASNCPGSADPEAPATQAYINCVCQTVNAPAYLFCLQQHCGTATATPITGVFAGWCAFNGGIGIQPCGISFAASNKTAPAAAGKDLDSSGRTLAAAA